MSRWRRERGRGGEEEGREEEGRIGRGREKNKDEEEVMDHMKGKQKELK